MKAARPPQRTSGWLTTVALVTFLAVAGPVLYGSDAPADQRDPARSYLVSAFNLTDPDLQRVQLGDVVVRPLTPTDPREFAVSGIVRIRVPPEFYVNHLAEIARFKRAAEGSSRLAHSGIRLRSTTSGASRWTMLTCGACATVEWGTAECSSRLTRSTAFTTRWIGAGRTPPYAPTA